MEERTSESNAEAPLGELAAATLDKLLRVHPARIRQLHDVLDCLENYLDDWLIFQKIIGCVARACRELLVAADQDDGLPAQAWNARNLLELWIWAKYCASSPQNCGRFVTDSLRDMVGSMHSLSAYLNAVGVPTPDSLNILNRNFELYSKAILKTEKVDTKFLRVAEAADQVGLGSLYRALNQNLSKFAHPTTIVIFTYGEPEVDRFNALHTVLLGDAFANNCITVVEEYVFGVSRG